MVDGDDCCKEAEGPCDGEYAMWAGEPWMLVSVPIVSLHDLRGRCEPRIGLVTNLNMRSHRIDAYWRHCC